MTEWPRYRLKQGGIPVAWADGRNASVEIAHYASIYSQDGPVQIEWRPGRKWRRLTLEAFRSLLSTVRPSPTGDTQDG